VVNISDIEQEKENLFKNIIGFPKKESKEEVREAAKRR
jgi:hypothetical protein